MVVKKDLRLIVCPCVFEPWALSLHRVSTPSSAAVSLIAHRNPLSSVRPLPLSPSLPLVLSLRVIKLLQLICFPVIYSFSRSSSSSSSPVSFQRTAAGSKSALISLTHGRDHGCDLQTNCWNKKSARSASAKEQCDITDNALIWFLSQSWIRRGIWISCLC